MTGVQTCALPIFGDVPERRRVLVSAKIELDQRDDEPRPVQIDLDSGKPEQANSPFLRRQHANTLRQWREQTKRIACRATATGTPEFRPGKPRNLPVDAPNLVERGHDDGLARRRGC